METFKLIKQLSKNSFSLAGNALRLVRLELTLAKKSLPVLAGLAFLLICLVTATWCFLLLLLGTYLVARGVDAFHYIYSVLGLHIALIIITAVLLRRYLSYLHLPVTQKHLRSILSSNQSELP